MIYDRICLMLPTYGRSTTRLPAFIDSAMAVSDPEICNFAFCVNVNDKETQEYLNKKDFGKFEHDVIFENHAGINLAYYFNKLYDESPLANRPGTMVSMLGDDMVFESPGWDKIILQWVNERNGLGVYYCNDMFEARDRCCVNMFVTREMVQYTGKPFMAQEFEAEMIDVVWHVAGRISKNLHFFPDLIIRHNHNRTHPREEWDATFNRLREVQNTVHSRGGKRRAIEIGTGIGAHLLINGHRGDSDC